MIEVRQFEKVKKKYALNNSYFKNTPYGAPRNPFEVLQYFKEYGELPFNNGEINENWFYDCIIEYQKRNGVYRSQFFTPPVTAKRIAEIADTFFTDKDNYVLDACSGFGALSMTLNSKGFLVKGFDIDPQFIKAYTFLTRSYFTTIDFKEYIGQFQSIVSNPPYDVKECTEFLECLYNWLEENGRAVLLLPHGFVSKERPKQLVQALNKFTMLHIEPMQEEFSRTKIRAEIVVLQKI